MKTQTNKTMKAIIEKPINYNTPLEQFNDVVFAILESNNEDELRKNMNAVLGCKREEIVKLKYGFGSSHMWVHEKESNERLLIVEF